MRNAIFLASVWTVCRPSASCSALQSRKLVQNTLHFPDRIRELHITEEQGKPFDQLDWSDGRRLNLDQYMAEHIYMFASKTSRARFRISKALVSDVIDLFGEDVWFFDETDTEVTVSALATEDAVEQFAKTYLPDVVILAPERLANRMQKTLEEITQKYRKQQEHKEDS